MEETKTAVVEDIKEASLDDDNTTTTFHLESETPLDEDRGAMIITLKSADGVRFALPTKFACVSSLIRTAVVGGRMLLFLRKKKEKRQFWKTLHFC